MVRSADLNEEASQYRPDSHGDSHGGSKVSKGAATLFPAEVLLDHSHALRVQQSGANTLHKARDVQRMRIRRETCHGGADGVDGDAEEKDASAPHEIAGAPSGDEDHAEGKRITR